MDIFFSVLPSFRGTDCDTDHYLVIENVRERVALGKQAAQRFDRQIFNLRKLNEPEVREQYQIEITNRFAALENLNDDERSITPTLYITDK